MRITNRDQGKVANTMRRIAILIVVYLFPFLAKAQEFGKAVVSFRTTAGDTVLVYSRQDTEQRDSVMLSVVKCSKNGRTTVQCLHSACSWAAAIDTISVHGQTGLLIPFDPAARYGNSFLYLFCETTGQFEPVDKFWRLGTIIKLVVGQTQVWYSYVSCGCADKCWSSVLFDIRGNQIDTLAVVRCDCENLVESSGEESEKTTAGCDEFNQSSKLEMLEHYWIDKLRKGL